MANEDFSAAAFRQGVAHMLYKKIAETLAHELYGRQGEPATSDELHRAMSDWVDGFMPHNLDDGAMADTIDFMSGEVDDFFTRVKATRG